MQLSAITAALGRFIAELQRRKVLRAAATYLVVAWVVLQVAVALQTAWALSAAFSGTILNLLIIGFPAVVGLAWFFEITPQGIKRTATSGDGAIAKLQTTDFVLAGALALVFCIGIAQFFWPREAAEEATIAAEPKAAASDADKPKVEPPRLGDKSIAVLPFVNLSKKDEDAVFADGLADQILDVLARVKGLRVISRTSSFAFKGKDTALPDVAKQLGVRHILEGSIRHEGDSVRITAQLIDVTTDTHLWSETFERKVDDVFAAQDDISRAVGLALNLEINAIATRGAPTKNLEAYRLYLKARAEFISLTRASMLSSIEHYKQAIALDPNFAEAQARLAMEYSSIGAVDPALAQEFAPKALALAKSALKINPRLASAYGMLSGWARAWRDWQGSFQYAEKSLALEPSNIDGLLMLGYSQVLSGNFEAATGTFTEAARVDPLYSAGELNLLFASFLSGDDAGVEAHAAGLREVKGIQGAIAAAFLATIAVERGQFTRAQALLPDAQSQGVSKDVHAAIVRTIGSRAHLKAALAALKKEEAENPLFDPAARLYLVGAKDEFLDAILGRATDKKKPLSLPNLMWTWHAMQHGLSGDARLKQYFREVGLVDYWRKNGWPDRCRAKGEDDFECS